MPTYVADIHPGEYPLFKQLESKDMPLPATFQEWSERRVDAINQHRREGEDVREVPIRFDDFHNHNVLLSVAAIGPQEIDAFAADQANRRLVR